MTETPKDQPVILPSLEELEKMTPRQKTIVKIQAERYLEVVKQLITREIQR